MCKIESQRMNPRLIFGVKLFPDVRRVGFGGQNAPKMPGEPNGKWVSFESIGCEIHKRSNLATSPVGWVWQVGINPPIKKPSSRGFNPAWLLLEPHQLSLTTLPWEAGWNGQMWLDS